MARIGICIQQKERRYVSVRRAALQGVELAAGRSEGYEV